MVTTDIVMFAIRGAMRLSSTARRAYVDATKQRAITLPLPRVNMNPTAASAELFFRREGQSFMAEHAVLADLHARYETLTPEEDRHFVGIYVEYRALDVARRTSQPVEWDGAQIPAHEFESLLTVRNWADGDEGQPKILQRVVGSVIDVAVDYFASGPGKLAKGSANERAIAGFVEALDSIKFEDVLVEQEAAERLVGLLLNAALETVAEQQEFLSGDPNVQHLVKVVAQGLTTDLGPRLAQLGDTDHAQRDELESWGELVFRSMLSSGGRAVIAEPARFLGVEDEAQGALIQNVGRNLIDLAVENDELDFGRILGREGLETVAQAALETLGDHPEVLGGDSRALNTIIAGLAATLAEEENLLSPDLLPEIARLVLVHTGQNLELIWPDAAGDPGQQALFIAAQEALAVLGADPGDAPWKPQLGKEEILGILDTTLGELAGNPAWVAAVLEDVDGNLGAMLEATLEVLRNNANERLSRGTAGQILAASVQAIALRSEFLEEIEGGQPFVSAAIEIVISALFDESVDEAAKWQLLRDETVTFAIGAVLDALSTLAKDKLDDEILVTLESFMTETVQSLAAGEALDFSSFEDQLIAKLIPAN